MSAADLHAIADLLGRELDEGFLSRLGPLFRRRYLATFSATPGSVALTAVDPGGAVVGFVVGSSAAGFHRAVLRLHWRRLLPAAVIGLLVRPRLAVWFLRTRAARYARAIKQIRREAPPSANAGSPGDGRSAGVLLHIAVEEAWRGAGLGARLLTGFCDAARGAGCGRAELVTMNGRRTFYEHNGWQVLASREDREGRAVVTYGRVL